MTNETIFITQIASVIAFVGSLFVLYRLLISQKDSVIELLKERLEENLSVVATAHNSASGEGRVILIRFLRRYRSAELRRGRSFVCC